MCLLTYGDEKMMETWQELENNAEKINQRLPGVELGNILLKMIILGGNKPHHGRYSMSMFHSDFEKMSDQKR